MSNGRRTLFILAMTVVATGCSKVGVGPTGESDLAGAGANRDGGAGDLLQATNAQLYGVWQIDGKDARGTYTGQLEVRKRADGSGMTDLYRIVRYTDITVEDSRELWWVWTGTGSINGDKLSTAVSLAKADFVHSRGGVTRTDADKTPLAVPGTIDAPVGQTTHAHFTVGTETIDDTLTNRADSGATPIFATDVTYQPVNAPPDPSTKSTLFTTFASFQALPAVMPYVNDPQFQEGVLDLQIDKTDYDFYQAHPKALRVVGKVIDAPSLGETLVRGNAYGQTLAGKAAYYGVETPATFLDPATGQLDDSIANGTAINSYDGALWTAAYVASQAFRYLVTQDQAALQNVAKSVVSIQLDMEITPDQTQFARGVRGTTGNAVAPWVQGVGDFAAYDWLSGGNNDMFKGLFYGTLTAYMVLCDPQISGYEALCQRMRTNAAHMPSLSIAGNQSNTNYLLASWLSAYVNGSLSDEANALESWGLLSQTIEQANFTTTAIATADWSGTHLNFVEMMSMWLLAQRAPLVGVNAAGSIKLGFGKMRDQFSIYRMGLWSMVFAKLAPSPAQIDIDNARWRLREFVAPKIGLDVDHRVSSAFVMAPYPSVPWKGDWTTTDRTQSIHGYPAFELPYDVYAWRLGPYGYVRNTEGITVPGADYEHAYWIGRWLGVLSATE